MKLGKAGPKQFSVRFCPCRNDEADVAHELALQKTLAELKLLAKEKFDQINMDKEKEGGLTAEEAAQLDQQILALEQSLKVGPGAMCTSCLS